MATRDNVPANQSGRSATVIESFGALWPGAPPCWVFTVREGCGDRGRVLDTFALGDDAASRARAAAMAREWCRQHGYDEVWEVTLAPVRRAAGTR